MQSLETHLKRHAVSRNFRCFAYRLQDRISSSDLVHLSIAIIVIVSSDGERVNFELQFLCSSSTIV